MSVDLRPEFPDMQGLVRFAHGHMSEASFLLLDIVDAGAAGKWLRSAPVTTAEAAAPRPKAALQIAFTAAGLRAMSVPEPVVSGFSGEFLEGMASPPSRSRLLGDVGGNDPERWHWGNPSSQPPHLLLMLYASAGELESWQARTLDATFGRAFRVRAPLPTRDIGEFEPFGFVDGISQPQIDWERTLSTDFHERARYTNLLSIGEILLGYPNEYGEYTARPLIDSRNDPGAGMLPEAEDKSQLRDLGRNGSYVVLRQLEQDVPGFWQFLDRQTASDDERERLAAAMVGRRRDGTPLLDQHADGAGNSSRVSLNAFDYSADPHGNRCPIGAHIRRSNPRTGDFPPGSRGVLSRWKRILGFGRRHPGDDLIASARFHRLLRRGREYGPPLPPEEAVKPDAPQAERGLQFVCLVASIERQFEFVQNAWSMHPKFGGVQNEADPLLGNRQPLITGEPTDRFIQPDAAGPGRCVHGIPQFVTLRGGGYFFLPGIRALRYIAEAPKEAGGP